MIKPEVVNQLSAIHELQLLMHLSKIPEWRNSYKNRQLLCESLSIADITLKVALKKLRNLEFIERVSKGVYKIREESIV